MIKVKNEENKNTSLQYIPVDKIEFLLTRIFGVWQREVRSVQLMLNSVVVVVRLHVLDPVTGNWRFHDGVGAAPVQLESGANASDMTQIKSVGVQIGAPAATSYALKDAAQNFGKLFGKDLNKHDALEFRGGYLGDEPTAKANEGTTVKNPVETLRQQQPTKEGKPKSKIASLALEFGENGKDEPDVKDEVQNDDWEGFGEEEEQETETDNDSFEL